MLNNFCSMKVFQMNKNDISNPCKDCITLGICKARLFELLNTANLTKNGVDVLVCMLELSVNCSILSRYLNGECETRFRYKQVTRKFNRALKIGEYILRGEPDSE